MRQLKSFIPERTSEVEMRDVRKKTERKYHSDTKYCLVVHSSPVFIHIHLNRSFERCQFYSCSSVYFMSRKIFIILIKSPQPFCVVEIHAISLIFYN